MRKKRLREGKMAVVPLEWMPNAKMQRIICHWTAGGHTASNLDRKHYHILIEGDGELVRGHHTIKDNESTGDGVYAAHTLGANTGSIGISACCMAGAQESPFDAGTAPMTETQWKVMAEVAAQLCHRYKIPVTQATVLGHGEVQKFLGKKQKGKWDPLVLPWAPHLSRETVGNRFRAAVSAAMAKLGEQMEAASVAADELSPSALRAQVNGQPLAHAIAFNESAYLKLSSLAAIGWSLVGADASMAVLDNGKGAQLYLRHVFVDEREMEDELSEADALKLLAADGYVAAGDFARALDLSVNFDLEKDTLIIDKPTSLDRPMHVLVQSGDTLFRIAEKYLGNGNRWKRLQKADGSPFTESDIPSLKIGTQIILPPASEAAAAPTPSPARTDGMRPAAASSIRDLIEAAAPEIRADAKVSIPVILAECEASGVTAPAQIAYILATSEHESKCGRFMRELWGPTAAQRGYEGRADLGNNKPGDGFRFRGRGYVQVTGRANYAKWASRLKLDIVSNPDLVAQDPRIAAKILVQGMKEGLFRSIKVNGKFRPARLDEFINENGVDFFNAREMINGDKHIRDKGYSRDRGTRIAEIAERYLEVLAREVPAVSPVAVRPTTDAEARVGA